MLALLKHSQLKEERDRWERGDEVKQFFAINKCPIRMEANESKSNVAERMRTLNSVTYLWIFSLSLFTFSRRFAFSFLSISRLSLSFPLWNSCL